MPGYVPPKLRQIVAEAVFRRKRLVLGTVGALFALALGATLMMHKKYEANAKLLVQNVRSAAQLTTSSVDHLVSQGDVSQAEINTEVDLLESDGVARRAFGQAYAKPSGKAAEAIRSDRAVDHFKRQLAVEAVHQTDVINLKMVGNSPEEARDNLQHVIDAYFEERAGTARNSGAAEFFQAQLEGKTKQLNADQAVLTAFQMRYGIADLDDQMKLQVARLSALQDQLAEVSATLASAQNRVATERTELSETPARSQTQVRTITNQYSQERLTTSLVDLQNRRTELLKRYVPADRQIVEVDEKIVTTRKAINEATAHPASEEATDANPVWVQLSTQIATTEVEISGLHGQQSTLANQIEAARQRLNELEQSTSGYGDLRRRLQQSQADYALYAQRRDEARISEALDRQKLFDVAVTQGPAAMAAPIRPRPLLYLSSALAFALLLGISFAVYADLAGGQVFTPAQLDAWTGTRTWATLADESATDRAGEANRRQYRRILLAIRQATAGEYPRLTSEHQILAEQGTPEVLRAAAAPPGLCIAFTSSLQGEGVSFTVNHLAHEASRHSSHRVAVLNTRTLLDRLELGEGEPLPLQVEQGAEHWVLALDAGRGAHVASPRDRRPHFASRLRPVLRQMRHDFDLVLLDCPSLQTSTLAAELAPCVDGYVSVVGAGAARRQNLDDLTAQLSSTSAPVLGHVLNRRIYPVPRWLHRII